MPHYGVKKGRQPGVYDTWEECEQQMKGYRGAVHQKFSTREEAAQFVSSGTVVSDSGVREDCPTQGKRVPFAAYYAVRQGRAPGIYHTWDDCRAQTERYPSADFKKFHTHEEAAQYMKEDRGADNR